MIIGVTGSIASGKSTVCNYLKEKGYHVIDCDVISHKVLKDNAKGISKMFDIPLVNNDINRKVLGDIVFNNKHLLKKLNDFLHPLIYNEVKTSFKELSFIDCPLLFETNFIQLVDKSLVVYTSKEKQINRLMNRNNFSFEEAVKRIDLQMSLDIKKEKADYVIYNDSLDDLYNNIDNFLKEI